MQLKKILENYDYKVLVGNDDVEINNITDNTNEVYDNDVFFCIKGFNIDGHNLINIALSKGAAAIVINSDFADKIDKKIECIVISVDDTRKALSIAAINFYNKPSMKMKMIGVTGTNGKTTTTYILKEIFKNAGYRTGLIGTVSNYINNLKIKSERTTPGALQLNQLLNNMVEQGVEYCFMEVSSHALELDRVYGIEFDYGIFTNLTQDHLDFHKNFDEYFNAKFKLFERSKIKIVNIDDTYGKKILQKLNYGVISYALNSYNYDYLGKNINLENNKTVFTLCDKYGKQNEFEYSLVGEFNIYNAIPAIIIAMNEGVAINTIKETLKKVFVPGRLENVSIKYNIDADIYIDYAHTPDGLENCLRTLRNICKGRLICVIGCGGDRDREKRPMIGKIATELSDYVYITSDNPRSEDPEKITDDIVEGVEKSNFEVVISRFDAIKKSIKNRKSNDIILIAGKGHEDYQIFKDKVIHFDEREVVHEILS